MHSGAMLTMGRQCGTVCQLRVEFNAPPDTIEVISEAVFTANHLTDTEFTDTQHKTVQENTNELNTNQKK